MKKYLKNMNEEELHLLEDIERSDALDYFKNNLTYNTNFGDLYIENDDFLHVFEHIDYIKEW